jgi:type IV secretory pathway TrbD component
MKDGTGTNDGTTMDAAAAAGASTGEDPGMDAANAAAIMTEAGERARQRLRPGHRGTFTAWGVLWFFGYGVRWLAVRGQQPFHGPAPAAFAAASLLATAAALATVEQARSETGVRGWSVVRRRAFLLSALAGYGAMFLVEGALARAGASRPVLAVFEATGLILVTGLLYLARSVTAQDWPVAGLGLWLVIVAAAAGYAGPRTVWAIGALAVGPAFLLVAAFEPWLHRS